MSNEMKPCPFCGGKTQLESTDPMYYEDDSYSVVFYVECQKCITAGKYYQTEQEAIEAWNRRVAIGELEHCHRCEGCRRKKLKDRYHDVVECKTCTRNWEDHYEK